LIFAVLSSAFMLFVTANDSTRIVVYLVIN